MFAEKVVKPESEVTPCSDARRFLYLGPTALNSSVFEAYLYLLLQGECIILAMLKHLSIRNLAIIENVDLDLKDGFSVLTGGTGAGKSLVIDSLSLLLGARASSELIRTGEDKAIITGIFDVSSSRLSALLSQLEIPCLDNMVKVERVIGKSKNVIKVNDVSVTLGELNQISTFLADIHNQFDFQKILNVENYLGIVDGFAYELVSPYKKRVSRFLSCLFRPC